MPRRNELINLVASPTVSVWRYFGTHERLKRPVVFTRLSIYRFPRWPHHRPVARINGAVNDPLPKIGDHLLIERSAGRHFGTGVHERLKQ